MLHDCWISGENKSWRIVTASKCRLRFFDLLEEIEQYIADLSKVGDDAKDKELAEIERLQEDPSIVKFELFFDFNSFKLNSDSQKKISEIIDALRKLNGNYSILLVGHADKVGDEIYNQALAFRRAVSVKNVLVKNKIPAFAIQVKGRGESYPRVVTSDENEKNQLNRRVSVYIADINESMSEVPLPLIDNYIYRKEIERIKKK